MSLSARVTHGENSAKSHPAGVTHGENNAKSHPAGVTHGGSHLPSVTLEPAGLRYQDVEAELRGRRSQAGAWERD